MVWTWIVKCVCELFLEFKETTSSLLLLLLLLIPILPNYFVLFLDTQFSGKRGKLPRYLHTSFSTPLVSVIYYCPWNLSYKHANTNDMAGMPNWCTFLHQYFNLFLTFLYECNQTSGFRGIYLFKIITW